MDTLGLTILTPEGKVFQRPVEALVAPGENGYFGVLPGHAPMVSALGAGILCVRTEEEEVFFVVGGGVAEVAPSDVTILADSTVAAAERIEAEEKLQRLKSGLGALGSLPS
jgi:F-type H+-transporting ATPase subunit epsilon